MLKDLSIYKDVRRNEKCPCGSGKIFKKCCMKEYREAKKNISNVTISTFSPLSGLSKNEKKFFTDFYYKLMIFTNQYKNNSETVIIDYESQNTHSFIKNERIYFYKHIDEIIDRYISKKNPTEEELLILSALKEAKFEYFFLISKSEENAVIMDENEQLYNIKALNSPFSEIFNLKEKYLGLRTSLIPYKNRYITDGIYEVFELDRDTKKHLNNLPYKNPTVIYNKNNDIKIFEFAINIAITCDIENFKKMDEIVLKEISHNHVKKLLSFFQNEYTFNTKIISSFLRTTDFLELLKTEKGNKTLLYLFSALPTSHYETGDNDDIIKYDLLKYYYEQIPFEKSVSYPAYEKSLGLDNKALKAFTSFYTMLGFTFVDGEKNYNEFKNFMDKFNDKSIRKKIASELEKMFYELSIDAEFTIFPTFLDVCTDLNDITDTINHYYEHMKKSNITSLFQLSDYSINKGNK